MDEIKIPDDLKEKLIAREWNGASLVTGAKMGAEWMRKLCYDDHQQSCETCGHFSTCPIAERILTIGS